MTKSNIIRPVLILVLGAVFLAGCANKGHHGKGHGNSGGHSSSSGSHDSGGHDSDSGGHSSGGHDSGRRVDSHGNVIEDDDYYPSH